MLLTLFYLSLRYSVCVTKFSCFCLMLLKNSLFSVGLVAMVRHTGDGERELVARGFAMVRHT